MTWESSWIWYAAGLSGILVWAWSVLQILTTRYTPAGTTAWLLLIVLMPFAGVPLYAVFGGRKVHSSMRCFASTSRQVLEQARALGVVEALEAAGVGLLEGMCFYILERLTGIREENRWVNLVSNSAKIVNTITAHRFRTILRPTAACVDIACSGKYA